MKPDNVFKVDTEIWKGCYLESLLSVIQEPSSVKDVHLTHIFPFQTIAGIRLTDTFLKRAYNYENLAQVFITNEKTEDQDLFLSKWVNDLS